MSIIAIFAFLVCIAIAVWIVQSSGWPPPISWGAYGILFIVVLILLLRVAGVDLGHI